MAPFSSVSAALTALLAAEASAVLDGTKVVDFASGAVNDDSTCVSLTSWGGGAFYTMPLDIGDPAQTLKVIPDTGSYDLLLDSGYCLQDGCMIHTQYRGNESMTGRNPASGGKVDMIRTAYGQGEVVSMAWKDQVAIGSLSASDVDMLLMVTEDLEGYAEEGPGFDGIMGIGRRNDTGNELGQMSLLSDLTVDAFSLCLGPMNDVYEGRKGGRFELGKGPLFKGIESKLQKMAPTGERAWATQMSAGSAGSSVIDVESACSDGPNNTCGAIIDSGTTLLTFPPKLHAAVRAAINDACPNCLETLENKEECGGAAFMALPDLNFVMGGVEISLPPSIYMASMSISLEGVAKIGPFVLPFTLPGVRCVPLFSDIEQVTNIGPLIIMGMPFMRSYATVFNRTTQAMSVAAVSASDNNCVSCPGEEDDYEMEWWKIKYDENGEMRDAASSESESSNSTTDASGNHSSPGGDVRAKHLGRPLSLLPDADPVSPSVRHRVESSSRSLGKHARPATIQAENIRWPWWAVEPSYGWNSPDVAAMRQQRRQRHVSAAAAKDGKPWRLIL